MHGGPGRAGDGEELGGIRGVLHYMQRTAIQGSPDTLSAVTGTWVTGLRGTRASAPVPQEPGGAAGRRRGGRRSADDHPGRHRAFADLSGDTFYAHMDEQAAAASPFFDGRVAHGYFVVSLAAGLFVDPGYGPVLANYGLENLRFTTPVYPGDALTVTLTARASPRAADADYGEVTWDADVVNQKGEYRRHLRRAHRCGQANGRREVTDSADPTLKEEPWKTARRPRNRWTPPNGRRSTSCGRCSWSGCSGTLRHAYDNVPHYRSAFDAAGVHPDDCQDLADLAKFPTTTKEDLRENYPFGMFAVPQERMRPHPRLVRHHRPARPSSATPRATSTCGPTVMARSHPCGRRPARRQAHIAYGYGLFTGGLGAHYGAERLGCTVIPISGGMTERQVQLIKDFEPDVIMVTPSYMLSIIDEMERQGIDRGQVLAEARHLRRRAVDRATCARRWRSALDMHAVDIYGLSEVIGPGRGAGVRRDQGRAAHLGGPLLPGDHRPGHRRGAARRRVGRTGVHLADQGGDAGRPLPHPRPDPAAARAPRGRMRRMREDHRPHRRHDHPARREPLPDPDRGDHPARAGTVAALPVRAGPPGPDGRADRAGRGRVPTPRPTAATPPRRSWWKR